MAQPKPDPLDNPSLKARTRAPGATVTTPRKMTGGGRAAAAQGHIGTAALSKKRAPAVAAFTGRLVSEAKRANKPMKPINQPRRMA